MKNFQKIISLSCLVFILMFSFPFVSSAQFTGGNNPIPFSSDNNAGCDGASSSGVGLSNPLKGGCSLYELIRLVINDVVLPIGGVLVVFFIIYSGYLLVTSAGSEEKLKTAKSTTMYTLIGAAVLLGSWVIALAVENTIKQITRTTYVVPTHIESHFAIRDVSKF